MEVLSKSKFVLVPDACAVPVVRRVRINLFNSKTGILWVMYMQK